MGDYVNGKTHASSRSTSLGNSNINISDLAKAIAKEIGGNDRKVVYRPDGQIDDGFDDAKSLDQLAKAMTVERGKSKSNFDDLGNIRKTERDQKETQDKIDLLRGLD